jgi:PIN domain nuclease of toxin-antitoxin system
LTPALLLDTHIIIRWVAESRKLSRQQTRVLDAVARRAEPVAVSAVSLIEIAALKTTGRIKTPLDTIWGSLRKDPSFRLIPISFEITSEMAAMGDALRDPFDWAIVATAGVHGLRLVTSDERIIDSKLVEVVD